MLLPNQSIYKCLCTSFDLNDPLWEPCRQGVEISIYIGNLYGVICVDMYSTDDVFQDSREYFFENSMTSTVLQKLRFQMEKTWLTCVLPNFECGLFERQDNKYPYEACCDDLYIMGCICEANVHDAYEYTLKCLFHSLQARIRKRTFFKRFYFRVFRLSFRPGNAGANRACAEFGAFSTLLRQ